MNMPSDPREPGNRPACADSRPRPTGFLGQVLAYTRALIVDQRLRWQMMFYLIIAAMVMVFVGAVFFFDWREHPWRFIWYWVVVGGLTMLVTLLAFYDLLLTRLQHRRLQRELQRRMLEQELEELRKAKGRGPEEG